MGNTLKKNMLSDEMISMLEYKIMNSELIQSFESVNSIFQAMLSHGMTYYTKECFSHVIDCELNIFINMIEILHIWKKQLKFRQAFCDYLVYVRHRVLNLSGVDLRGNVLDGVGLRRCDLRGADLRGAVLNDVDLSNADLRGADLRGAVLIGVNFSRTDLSGAYLDKIDVSVRTVYDEPHFLDLDNIFCKTIFDEENFIIIANKISMIKLLDAKIEIRKEKKVVGLVTYIENYAPEEIKRKFYEEVGKEPQA